MSADPSFSRAAADACVAVSPEQFKIDVELNREVFLDLTLTNTSSSLVTFKVKTTARDRYLLRPTQDYIPPHGVKICKIVMTRMKEYPDLSSAKNLRDKFLVQSTPVGQEVPDLTKYWKDLEAEHDPKSGRSLYFETKIKCKLNVPAKLRAQDAAKRGQAEEEAASAAQAPAQKALAESSEGEGKAAAAPPPSTSSNIAHAPAHPTLELAPAPVASNSTPASQTTLEAEKQRYSELMAFVVTTTQQLEAERQEKEAAESKALAAVERAKLAETRATKAEKALISSQEEMVKLAALVAASSRSSTAAEKEVAAPVPAPQPAAPTAIAPALEKPSPAAGLNLQLWQAALLALMCFVLGRIFSGGSAP